MKKGLLWKILTPILAVLMIVSIVAIPVTNSFANAINVALGAKTQEIVPEEGASVYFVSNYDSEEDLVAFEKQLCRDIESEGAALLVNRDNTLPLAAGTKFTTFSQSSFNLLYGGTGSGQVSADDAVTLKSAFDEVFGADSVNPEQWKFYATAGYKRVNAATTGGNQGQYRIKAPRLRGDTAGQGGSGGAERLTRGRRERFRQRGILPHHDRNGALAGLQTTERTGRYAPELRSFQRQIFCLENLLSAGICTERELCNLVSFSKSYGGS